MSVTRKPDDTNDTESPSSKKARITGDPENVDQTERGECERGRRPLSSLCDAELQCILHFLPLRDRLHAAFTCRQFLHAARPPVAWKYLDGTALVALPMDSRTKQLQIENSLLRHVPVSMKLTERHFPESVVAPLSSLFFLKPIRWTMFMVPNPVKQLSIDASAQADTWTYLAQHPRVQPCLHTMYITEETSDQHFRFNGLPNHDAVWTHMSATVTRFPCLHTLQIEFTRFGNTPQWARFLETLHIPSLTSLTIRDQRNAYHDSLNMAHFSKSQLSTLQHLELHSRYNSIRRVSFDSLSRLETLVLRGVQLDETAYLLQTAMPRLHSLTFGRVYTFDGNSFITQVHHLPTLSDLGILCLSQYATAFPSFDVLDALFLSKPHLRITVRICEDNDYDSLEYRNTIIQAIQAYNGGLGGVGGAGAPHAPLRLVE